jgi:hypothetical protein
LPGHFYDQNKISIDGYMDGCAGDAASDNSILVLGEDE